MRYHKDVYIPIIDKVKLEAFNVELNSLKWRYTSHCIDNIKYRIIRLEEILNFIKDLILDYKDIFEYSTLSNGDIYKACYRLPYTENIDVILIISDIKSIITVYINEKVDKHITLNKSLYTRE